MCRFPVGRMAKLVVPTVTEDSPTLLPPLVYPAYKCITPISHVDWLLHVSCTGVRLELHGEAGGHVSGHRPQPGVPGGLHRAPGQARHRDGGRYVCGCGEPGV
jgi:hypothetical protein